MGEHDTFFRRVFSAPARAGGLVRSVFPSALVQVLALRRDDVLEPSLGVLHEVRARYVRHRIVEVLPETEPTMVSYAEYLENKGLVRGLVEGRAEGRAEGEVRGQRLALRELLEARFGTLPPDVLARIESASDGAIDAAGSRRLTATTPAEVMTRVTPEPDGAV